MPWLKDDKNYWSRENNSIFTYHVYNEHKEKWKKENKLVHQKPEVSFFHLGLRGIKYNYNYD